MDGFTGLNIERARQEIENFYNQGFDVYFEILHTTQDLYNVLVKKWASPKAHEFDMKYHDDLATTINDFKLAIEHIASGAVGAANALATVNGEYFSCNVKELVPDGSHDGIFLPSLLNEYNGAVGMATENVRIARDVYSLKMKQNLQLLNNLPKNISFYSADDSLITTYNTSIDHYQKYFSDKLDEIVADLNANLEAEENNIRLAKNEAQSILEEKAV